MTDINKLEQDMLDKAAEIAERGPVDAQGGWDPESWWQEMAERRERREHQRAIEAEKRRRRDRVYVGEDLFGVSQRHEQAKTDVDKLTAAGLPVLKTEQDLADWLGIPLSRLRWFTHDKPADTVWHYVRFTIPKRRGGKRVIMAPKSELKAHQRKVLDDLLALVPVSDHAHGFVTDRSIVSNAAPHVGQQIVLNMDLKDFFPSIGYHRVRGVFISLGYGYGVALALALLCTARERVPYEHDGTTVFVAIGERVLIQGAPTSPALSNLVARRLDHRLSSLADAKGFAYTRYADDLTFSGADIDAALRILDTSGYIIADEGFRPHPAKTKLYRPSSRQMVTGLVVNDKVNVPRDLRRRLRAILHQAQYTGLDAQNREGRPHFRAYLRGLIAFIHAANPEAARKLRRQLDSIPDRYDR